MSSMTMTQCLGCTIAILSPSLWPKPGSQDSRAEVADSLLCYERSSIPVWYYINLLNSVYSDTHYRRKDTLSKLGRYKDLLKHNVPVWLKSPNLFRSTQMCLCEEMNAAQHADKAWGVRKYPRACVCRSMFPGSCRGSMGA
jgi:hypothetical protein